MKQHTIESFTDYVNYVESECCDEEILFRGQQQDWPLLPKIARLKYKKEVPIAELEMFQKLIEVAHPYISGKIEPFSKGTIHVDILAYAQHNGMATRLLDWTLNPLAALWFAVRRPPAVDKTKSLSDGVVWSYCPMGFPKPFLIRGYSPFLTGNIVASYRPCHVTPQITAQQGLFTVHGYNEDDKCFSPMEENEIYGTSLTKIIIPAKQFSGLRYQLDRCGVNEASMFPGIEGLCRYLEWYHTLLDDEIVIQ
jgi:hypothetical protein